MSVFGVKIRSPLWGIAFGTPFLSSENHSIPWGLEARGCVLSIGVTIGTVTFVPPPPTRFVQLFPGKRRCRRAAFLEGGPKTPVTKKTHVQVGFRIVSYLLRHRSKKTSFRPETTGNRAEKRVLELPNTKRIRLFGPSKDSKHDGNPAFLGLRKRQTPAYGAPLPTFSAEKSQFKGGMLSKR